RDAPNPITFSKEMMSREVRNEGAVLLLERANTAQNFGIEIHQPEPENILLFIDLLMKLQQLGEHAVAPGRIDQPARTQCVFPLRRILHGHSVQFTALANIDSRHGAVDHFYPVLQVAGAYLAIECKAVYLEREQRRHCRHFVDDVSTINAMVDVALEIIGEAVFRIVPFNKVSTKSKFQKEINGDFDEGFADDWTVLVRALNHSHLQIREAHPQVGGRKLAGCSASHNQDIARHGAFLDVSKSQGPVLPPRSKRKTTFKVKNCASFRADSNIVLRSKQQGSVWPCRELDKHEDQNIPARFS